MSDPIEDAFKALHQGNLLAAKDARIKQLEAEVERLTKAGDEFSEVMNRLAMFSNEENRLIARTALLVFNAAKDGKSNG